MQKEDVLTVTSLDYCLSVHYLSSSPSGSYWNGYYGTMDGKENLSWEKHKKETIGDEEFNNKIKNNIEGLNSRLGEAGEQISHLEGQSNGEQSS